MGTLFYFDLFIKGIPNEYKVMLIYRNMGLRKLDKMGKLIESDSFACDDMDHV